MTPSPSIVFLMYHELEIPGRSLSELDPGYARYAVSEPEFRGQMQHLQDSGYKGVSVSEALECSSGKRIAITFDDGSETDLLIAAPLLLAAGFNATFYITSGWLGQPGRLSSTQLVELSRHGFEIGCHSMTHAYLTELSEPDLKREIVDAKSHLEQIIGRPVEHFSCPGGRYNDRVAQAARGAGFHSVATSRVQANSSDTDEFNLGRVSILRGLPMTEFAAISNGEALLRLRAQSGTRDVAKRLMGSALYDRVRKVLLGSRE